MIDLDTLDFDKGSGLVTVVAQDATTGAVLMVAHADREALERTAATGEMHYRSRSRGLWHKGATSGNVQRVVALAADCDGDAVLALVLPAGPACHTGSTSCFGSMAHRADALSALDATIGERAAPMTGVTAAGPGEGVPEAGVPEAAPVGDAARGAPPEPEDRAALAGSHHRSAASPIVPSSASSESAAPAGSSYTRRLLADRNLRLKKLGEEAAELVLACADEDRPRAAGEAADLLYHSLVAVRALGLTMNDVRRELVARAAR